MMLPLSSAAEGHPLFAELPNTELDWLTAHANSRRGGGAIVAQKGSTLKISGLCSQILAIRVDRASDFTV